MCSMKNHHNKDNEAVITMLTTVATFGLNHAYLAARVTYGQTVTVRLDLKRAAKALQTERERRYAAIGCVCRDIFDT